MEDVMKKLIFLLMASCCFSFQALSAMLAARPGFSFGSDNRKLMQKCYSKTFLARLPHELWDELIKFRYVAKEHYYDMDPKPIDELEEPNPLEASCDLFDAIYEEKDEKKIRQALRNGATPYIFLDSNHNWQNFTSIIGHCINNYPVDQAKRIINLLLDYNADPNSNDNFPGPSNLFLAGKNRIELVKLLLAVGADPFAKDGERYNQVYVFDHPQIIPEAACIIWNKAKEVDIKRLAEIKKISLEEIQLAESPW